MGSIADKNRSHMKIAEKMHVHFRHKTIVHVFVARACRLSNFRCYIKQKHVARRQIDYIK